MATTTRLGLPYIEASQAQKHVTHNEALRILDSAIQLAVLDLTRTAPPADPAEGDRHIVAAGASGAWLGADHAIATREDGAWRLQTPQIGWIAWSIADDVVFVWDGTEWRDLRELPVSLDDVSELGINGEADSGNRLRVHGNAALFDAIGAAEGGTGDMRVQIAKETNDDTASVVFANAFSGRAEFGLTGSDALALKVSPDGSAWADALEFDPATAQASFRSAIALTATLSPSELTGDADDYAPSGFGDAAVINLSATSSIEITGLAGGTDGRVLVLVNVGTQSITLKNQASASSAANRFAAEADIMLGADAAALLRYDGGASRWRILARPPGQSAASGDLELRQLLLAMATARNAGLAQFLGTAFADSFGALTYVDVAGATNLNTGTAGVLKSTSATASDQTATHTAATTGGNTVTHSQSAGAGFDGWKAFDKVTGGTSGANCWHTSNQPYGWITYQFASAKTIGSYTIRSPNGLAARAPKTWTLKGSNTGAFAGEETVLDTRTNVAAWASGGETRSYSVSSPASFVYYRLDVTVNQGDASYLCIDEITLLNAAAADNLVVASASIAMPSAPAFVVPLLRIKHISGAVAGTDYNVQVSRDGGATWSSNASLTDWFTDPVDSAHVVHGAPVDVSAQPSGANVRLRLTTANNKNLELCDWGFAAS